MHACLHPTFFGAAHLQVVIDLAEPEPGNTVLTLLQTGLPAEDKFGNSDVQSQVSDGWQQQVFRAIKTIFGYGV